VQVPSPRGGGPDDLAEDEDQGWRGLIEEWIDGLPEVDE
jgi:hypothetical protein